MRQVKEILESNLGLKKKYSNLFLSYLYFSLADSIMGRVEQHFTNIRGKKWNRIKIIINII